MHTVMEMKNHSQAQQMRRQKLDHQIKIAENHIRSVIDENKQFLLTLINEQFFCL